MTTMTSRLGTIALMLLFTAITILPISSPVFAQEEEEEMLQPHPNPIDGDTASNNAPPVPDGDPLAEKGRIDKVLLGESLGLGARQPTLPTSTQGGVALRGGNVMQQLGDDDQRPAGVEIGEIKVHIGTQDMNPSAARSLQATPAIQAMPPSIMPPSIKPTQGTQAQKVDPAAKATNSYYPTIPNKGAK